MKQGKSPKSALILSAATIISFAVTDAVLNLLVPYLISGDIHDVVADPRILSQPGNLIGLCLFIILIMAIMIAIGAFWLYRFFGEKYFDELSLLRWTLFGFLFAVFLKIPEWIFGQKWWVARVIFQFAGLFGAFFLARWITPIKPENSR